MLDYQLYSAFAVFEAMDHICGHDMEDRELREIKEDVVQCGPEQEETSDEDDTGAQREVFEKVIFHGHRALVTP